MKDLILITAYCPDFKKIKMLQSLLINLSNFRDDYDIMITSHSKLDSTTQEYCDYYFYNKNNNLLTDFEYLQNGFFIPYNNYKIWSTYILGVNTLLAIYDLMIPSLKVAKTLGYNKIHYLEYDTELTSVDELKQNSKDLEYNDYVIYQGKNTHKLVGAFMSFNIYNIIDEWENYSENKWKNLFKSIYPKVPEDITFNLISKQRKVIIKNFDELYKNGIKTCLIQGTKLNWCFPFFDHEDYMVKFLCRNQNEDVFNMSVIVNNDKLIKFNNVDKNEWSIKTLDSIEKVESIIVLKNNKHFYNIDFNKSPNFKDNFLRLNYVNKDE